MLFSIIHFLYVRMLLTSYVQVATFVKLMSLGHVTAAEARTLLDLGIDQLCKLRDIHREEELAKLEDVKMEEVKDEELAVRA
jgi:hypothetical protein